MDGKFLYCWTQNWYDLTCDAMCLPSHTWLGNIIETVKSAGKSGNINKRLQIIFYSKRNKRQGKDKTMLWVGSTCIVEFVRYPHVGVCYINYLLPLGGSILADILKKNAFKYSHVFLKCYIIYILFYIFSFKYQYFLIHNAISKI